jgi:CheY-like chemotaxis protein
MDLAALLGLIGAGVAVATSGVALILKLRRLVRRELKPPKAPPTPTPLAPRPSLASLDEAEAAVFLAGREREELLEVARVLVADDDGAMRSILMRAIQGIERVEVRGASTLDETRAALLAWHPDVVLLDVRWSEHYAWDLGEDLHASGAQVVLVSGAFEPETLARLTRHLGAVRCLLKPGDTGVDNVRRIVGGLLHRQR